MTMEQVNVTIQSTPPGEGNPGGAVMMELDEELVLWLAYILKTKIKFGKSRVANGQKGVLVSTGDCNSTNTNGVVGKVDTIRLESTSVGVIAEYLVCIYICICMYMYVIAEYLVYICICVCDC